MHAGPIRDENKMWMIEEEERNREGREEGKKGRMMKEREVGREEKEQEERKVIKISPK